MEKENNINQERKKILVVKDLEVRVHNIGDISSRLVKITREEAKNYELLGGASSSFGGSMGLNHCIYMGLKYCDGFAGKAKYYVKKSFDDLEADNPMQKPENNGCLFIDFYGDKNAK